VGREFGYRLLLRFGGYLRLTKQRIKLGQYLFLRHGQKVVFFGRFIPILRVLAGLLAGMNRMRWRQFLIANAAGAVLWVIVIGMGAYAFGRTLLRMTGPVAVCLFLVGAAALIGAGLFVRRHEAELEAEAERALPGPLQPVHRRRVRTSH
jgi:membrane protein DedA with SNARE-associated domain